MPRSFIGSWAFLIGVILAIVLGAFSAVGEFVTVLLVVLGLVIGFLNITEKETTPFLTAGAVLVIVSALGAEVLGTIGVLNRILVALLTLFVPATIIVALRSVFKLAKH
jgi:hypothetical protein